jgi:hypothetical protein
MREPLEQEARISAERSDPPPTTQCTDQGSFEAIRLIVVRRPETFTA